VIITIQMRGSGKRAGGPGATRRGVAWGGGGVTEDGLTAAYGKKVYGLCTNVSEVDVGAGGRRRPVPGSLLPDP